MSDYHKLPLQPPRWSITNPLRGKMTQPPSPLPNRQHFTKPPNFSLQIAKTSELPAAKFTQTDFHKRF